MSGIGLFTSFGAGVISFLSPCVLPLVPGYVSYVAGDALTVSGEPRPLAALRLASCFVLGFSTVFVILGASASSIGQLLLSYREEESLIGGAIVLVFGLFMVGLAKLSWLQREFRLHPKLSGGRPIAAYVIGVAFAFGWTPCIGPVLAAVLGLASDTHTLARGEAMLVAYSLGLGVPFVALGVAFGRLAGVLAFVRRHLRVINLVSGALLAGLGVLLVTNELHVLSNWASDVLDAIGLGNLRTV